MEKLDSILYGLEKTGSSKDELLKLRSKVANNLDKPLDSIIKELITEITEATKTFVESKNKNGISYLSGFSSGIYLPTFDGSGEVIRGSKANLNTYELCKFSNGKIYNCDLSASYNIASRYFIREIQKSISERNWSLILTKVLDLGKRTNCTYNTLLELNKVI